jgi:DNA-binding winged helix-turn-helix (wHTH) protein/TolB-like protein/Tfp pilus assembly protein PilF
MRISVTNLYEFGPFQLDPPERLLLCNGRPVPLPPRAFDLLLVLVERQGHLVEKEELLRQIWADSFVEESNLAVNISFLRKVLNDDRRHHRYIETVSKKGYRFVAEVRQVGHSEPPQSTLDHSRKASVEPPATLPAPIDPPVWTGEREASRKVSYATLFGAALFALVLIVILSRAVQQRLVYGSQPAESASIHSLAVLPFQTLGSKGDDDYIGLGMADALISRLANTGKISVRPTSAVQRYATGHRDPKAVGQEQGVEAVLDGRIQQEGGHIRLTVQLIRVRDGVQLWGDTFDQQSQNIFALEDELSERMAQSIRLQLTGEESRRFTKRLTEKPDAYEAYVKGRYFWNKRTEVGLNKGLEYFRQAISLDPAFAEAYVGIADSYAALGLYGVHPPNEAFPAAREAGKRALEMDDSLAEAHATLGFIDFYYEWNAADSAAEFRRALASNPHYAMAHSWYAESLAAMGHYPEAVAEAHLALEDDPLSPIISTNAGWALSLAGRYDEAIDTLKKAIEIDPNFPRAHFRLGKVYEQKGLYTLAISELEQAVRLAERDSYYQASLGHAYAVSGDMSRARSVLENLQARSRRQYAPAYGIALVYAGLGEKDSAFEWLQKAYEDRSTSMVFLKVDPELTSLRSDPRFVQLSQRINY